MPRIPGFYEYDDDNLTPGKKKEGGLHQNLFDHDGNLKGNARFIPDENRAEKPDRAKNEDRRTRPADRSEKADRRTDQHAQTDPEVVHETVYVYETVHIHDQSHDEEHERRLTLEREENQRLQAHKHDEQAKLIADIARVLFAAAAPHAKRFWQEKARPVVDERRAKKAARKARREAATEPIVVDAAVADTGGELAVAEQARYLSALAARAFSDEQMRFVFNANIVDGEGLAELQQTLAELPPHQVRSIIKAVEANPAALSADLSAELGTLLGLDRAERDVVPIEKIRGQYGRG